jgi:hypothetical protein
MHYRGIAGQVNYKHHTIISYVRPSEDHSGFLPGAVICWKTAAGKLFTFFLKLKRRYSIGQEARNAALEAAKAWIDSHLES